MAVENINPETEPVPASWVPRVITGGKGPPEPPTGGTNYLSDFEVGTYFACRVSDKTLEWELYLLLAKPVDNVYILRWSIPDGRLFERTVDPKIFCRAYRDYEVLWVYKQQEPENGSN